MTSPQTHSRPSTLSALALAIAALSHVGAHAAASQDELKGTKLYASVSIADDSTDSWGPWSNFEPPAAGRDVSPALPKVSTELYRPLAQVAPSFGPACVAGGLCGFGAFQGNDSSRNNNSSMSVAPHAVQLVSVVTQTYDTDDHRAGLPKAIQMYTTALTPGVSILMPDSGELLRTENTDGNSLMSDLSVHYSRSSQSESNGGQREEQVTMEVSSNLPEETRLLDGAMYTNISNYTKGVEGQGAFASSQDRRGPIVWGYTTPDSDMAGLRTDKATASYNGFAHGGALVQMNVQFGPGTWDGSWNNGKDGENGMGFTAKGTFKGVMLQSTSVGTSDVGATVTGQVNAAFYGMQAAAIGGVADITKTMPAAPMPVNLQPARVGAPQSSGYTNARYVETFTAVQVTPASAVDKR